MKMDIANRRLAGVWGNRAQAKWQFIEPGDVEAAMQTASAIGDDRLQHQAQGRVVPDSFTHGTSVRAISALPLSRRWLNALIRFAKKAPVSASDSPDSPIVSMAMDNSPPGWW